MQERARTLDELGDEITTLAAHIHAATCRWLELVAEFDEREGWAPWGCRSCAHWISWRCSIAPGAAREHVRVARRLRSLPLIRAAFAAGTLSFSQVRALTRVEDVEREGELLELARSATAAQLERMVRGYRGVVAAEAGRSYAERFVSLSFDDDGSVVVRGRLPAELGAVVMKAFEAARDRDASGADVSAETHEGPEGGVSAETRPLGARNADALVLLAEESLAAAQRATRTGGDRFQVVVHVDAATLAAGGAGERCELEGGEPLAAETARRLCCDASLVALAERAGKPLSVGRKTRAIPPALRRALRSRDRGCRFPGCTERRWVDAHHIRHWAHGGETSLPNLVQLCGHHHRLVHEGGFAVERRPGDEVVFRRPDGRRLHPVTRAPRRGDPGCVVEDTRRRGHHITPATCVPDWYGDRLRLGDAVEALLTFAPLPAACGP
jgi:hypothetical protein